jgi:hypothetical protein
MSSQRSRQLRPSPHRPSSNGWAIPAFLLVLGSSVARAQTEPTLGGVVIDAGTSRPIIGAIVTLVAQPSPQTTRTDGTGSFSFFKIASGEFRLTVRQLGYEPADQTVRVDSTKRVTISMNRLTTLDTVRVGASAQAIYGVVAMAHDLRPLSNATVQVFGTSVGQVTTDSGGRFFYSVRTPGAYFVRAKGPRGGSQTVSVTVPQHEGIEVALLLDSVPPRGAGMLEMAFSDFRSRVLRRGIGSVIVPRQELLRNGNVNLMTALATSPSFAASGLRFSDAACVFVDGIARSSASVNLIDAAEIETVEVYSAEAERSGTLAMNWPRAALCPNTGMPRSGGGIASKGIVKWVVIWLKH